MSARKKLEIKGKSTVSKIMIPSVDKLINHTKVLQKKKNLLEKPGPVELRFTFGLLLRTQVL